MAKINRNAQEETNDDLAAKIEPMLTQISVTTEPVLICGVLRRAGLGQWEHLDVYAGIALPMPNASLEDHEALKQIAMEAAEVGFGITSAETYSRYALIKNVQNGRKEEESK